MELHDFTKIDRRTRNSFVGALVLLAGFFIYGRIAEPQVTYLFALNRCEKMMDKVGSRSKIMEGNLKIREKKLEELNSQFAYVRNILYTQAQAEEFFSDLQAVSVETECPIYSLTFIGDEPTAETKQAEESLGVTTRKAVLSVAGVYENVMILLERLQNRSRKVWLEGIRMELISDDVLQIKCDIIVKIYTIQSKEAARHE